MAELLEILPNATIVKRNGEVNAWDDDNFRAAVEATGKSQVILSGITTDVCTSNDARCVSSPPSLSPLGAVNAPPDTLSTANTNAAPIGTTFAALSMADAGYQVFANGEASGSSSQFVRDMTNDRMRQGGVQVVSMFAIMSELMRSWGATPGAAELFPFLDQYYPAYASVARAFNAASSNSTA